MTQARAGRPETRQTNEDYWRGLRRVLVLQGGGALGAYQAGAYAALAERDLAPHWVAGISIGAVNAALIAGNPPERRVERLRRFWERASSLIPRLPGPSSGGARALINRSAALLTLEFGAPGFFAPRVVNPFLASPGSAQAVSWYDTSPLRATLEELVDFDLINEGPTRLTVGAVNVLTGDGVAFDSTKCRIGPDHIMASGALPPGFPPVFVDGQPCWDGGLLSNSPLQFVLDDRQTEDRLVFQIDLFDAKGALPRDLFDVDDRQKDIRYSSRTRVNTDMQKRLHEGREALRAVLDRLPAAMTGDADVAKLRELARDYETTIVQLIYRKKTYEGGSRDFEFSRQTMRDHWASGRADVKRCARRGMLPHRPRPGLTIIDT